MACIPWRFQKGSPFTSVTLNGPTIYYEGDYGVAQQHAHWWVTYASDDGQSHFTESYTDMVTEFAQQVFESVNEEHRIRFYVHEPHLSAVCIVIFATPLLNLGRPKRYRVLV